MTAPPALFEYCQGALYSEDNPALEIPQVLVLNTSDEIQLHPIWVHLKHLASHLVMPTKTPARKKEIMKNDFNLLFEQKLNIWILASKVRNL